MVGRREEGPLGRWSRPGGLCEWRGREGGREWWEGGVVGKREREGGRGYLTVITSLGC